jgi:hypothetical protein
MFTLLGVDPLQGQKDIDPATLQQAYEHYVAHKKEIDQATILAEGLMQQEVIETKIAKVSTECAAAI